MGGTVFRQWNARSAARPEFHIKQRGVGDRKLACEILLPFELLVDQREPLLGVLAAGRLHRLMIRLRRSEAIRAEDARKALGMDGTDDVLHRLIPPGCGLLTLRDEVLAPD